MIVLAGGCSGLEDRAPCPPPYYPHDVEDREPEYEPEYGEEPGLLRMQICSIAGVNGALKAGGKGVIVVSFSNDGGSPIMFLSVVKGTWTSLEDYWVTDKGLVAKEEDEPRACSPSYPRDLVHFGRVLAQFTCTFADDEGNQHIVWLGPPDCCIFEPGQKTMVCRMLDVPRQPGLYQVTVSLDTTMQDVVFDIGGPYKWSGWGRLADRLTYQRWYGRMESPTERVRVEPCSGLGEESATRNAVRQTSASEK